MTVLLIILKSLPGYTMEQTMATGIICSVEPVSSSSSPMKSDKDYLSTDNNDTMKMKKKISLINGICLIVGNMHILLTIADNQGHKWDLVSDGALCYGEQRTTISKSGTRYAYVDRLWLDLWLLSDCGRVAITLTLYQALFPMCNPSAANRLIAADYICKKFDSKIGVYVIGKKNSGINFNLKSRYFLN
uniref:Uncharacterized protein n=1 Tax=Callorhinchus milii TaxID=7868 RepID=A0A4W3IFA3_CALMI